MQAKNSHKHPVPNDHTAEPWSYQTSVKELSLILRSADLDKLFDGPDPSAHLDPLTGLATRQQLLEFIDALLSETTERPSNIALILLDIDRFKMANDSFGPKVCDALLCRVAQRLRFIAKNASLLARVSGDGFAIVLKDIVAAPLLAERLLEFVGRSYAVNGQVVSIRASIGVASAGDFGHNAIDLLQEANLALHQAQSDGGNRVLGFRPCLKEEVQARDAMQVDFRAAIALQQVEIYRAVVGKQFSVHYQPQVALSNGRVTGFEALLRWRHPVRGFIPPSDFIPLAEELGLINVLGDWVLQTACRDAACWPLSRDGMGLRVGVNVSPVQFRDGPGLLTAIERALAESGLPPSRLEIELTETALSQDIRETLAAIRQLGVELALDDFGTGYSSLSRLSRYPFNRIKIDRSFVADLDSSTQKPGQQTNESVIRAIASLGAAFGLETIVEGIETTGQMEIARRTGCTEMQGYLVSRPVPGPNVNKLIERLEDARTEKGLGCG